MTDIPGLSALAVERDGIVTRRDVLEHGGSDEWIEAQLRARRIRRLHRKVYSLYNGEPTA